MEKQSYFVIWRSGTDVELSPMLPDTQLIHYEVVLDKEGKQKIEDKLAEVQEGDVMPEQIFTSPFDETKDEKEKLELGRDEDNLFHMIYTYGTPETKKRLEQMYNS
ncbi:hypothetical protein [Alkalicoccus daliensis]|uniref:Uncharacterized protein n=1 Tax=Alkalicoccus daliensis TaxID=745820 RepID=A0A1H0BDC6_9BACI|nr:hypothetical protein [Alkalicoccus daliensis]SDN43630.1 hypothetical protein SAMN04488053_101848 [Alkalicoccus daliensis]